jgi:exodeoxyribonuclease VII small subunit
MVQLFNEEQTADDANASEGSPQAGDLTPSTSKRTAPSGAGSTTTPSGTKFEDAYQRLETLVAEMERGDLPLEQLLARFEEGVGLVRHCRAFLKQAQLRVEQYVEQRDGHWVLKDLE